MCITPQCLEISFWKLIDSSRCRTFENCKPFDSHVTRIDSHETMIQKKKKKNPKSTDVCLDPILMWTTRVFQRADCTNITTIRKLEIWTKPFMVVVLWLRSVQAGHKTGQSSFLFARFSPMIIWWHVIISCKLVRNYDNFILIWC